MNLINEFKQLQTRLITDQEIDIIFKIEAINRKGDITDLYNKLKTESWVLRVIEQRVFAHKVEISLAVQCIILTICDARVGLCVLFIDYLACLINAGEYKQIDTPTFLMDIIPDDVPTIDSMIALSRKLKNTTE